MSEKNEEWPVIGIDLGTKYSCVGVWKDGRVEIITNDQNNRTTPSSVAFTDTVRLIGETAVNQGRLNPAYTIFDTKRLIGRRIDDEMLRNDMRLWPFEVISGCEFVEEKKPMVVIRYKGEYKYFSAEELSAMILMKMKHNAEAYLDVSVKNAVITVPAYFNDSQRQATKDAGTIAGLNVLSIINEPTAAAVAYSFNKNMSVKDSSKKNVLPYHKRNKSNFDFPKNNVSSFHKRNKSDYDYSKNFTTKNVLVFDLGGGTFDVSLITMENDNFTVKAVGGNTHLGGTDFDNNMIDYFVEEFRKMHNKDVSKTPKALARLRAACEKAKRALSLITEISVEVDCLFDGLDFTSSISRAKFESLNKDLFSECIHSVKVCLQDARVGKTDVDDILLVGGSTRIPKVQQLLQEFFDGKELCKSTNPDEVVAYGAAIHAATFCGVTSHKDMVLIDVTPLSLVVKVCDGTMSVVIPKNTPIPTRHVYTYTAEKVEMNMDGANNAHLTSLTKIHLYEGEGLKAEDNILLGVVDLYVPQSSVNVWFEIDINGILNVSTEDTRTGGKRKMKINNHSSLTKINVCKMKKEAQEYTAEDKKYEEMVKAKNTLENYANEQWETISNSGKRNKNRMLQEVRETLDWLDLNSGNVFEAAEYMRRLTALQKLCTQLMGWTC